MYRGQAYEDARGRLIFQPMERVVARESATAIEVRDESPEPGTLQHKVGSAIHSLRALGLGAAPGWHPDRGGGFLVLG